MYAVALSPPTGLAPIYNVFVAGVANVTDAVALTRVGLFTYIVTTSASVILIIA